ncbi:MAG: hypothetical protein LBS61_04575 [Endomicrobium sp.]|jgi:lipoate-protein ligase A|nr:hypothetical protein [Endomicrobium sp.]
MNMAIDEALFDERDEGSFIRIYRWDNPCTTIGYFQKSKDVSQRKIFK